MPKFFLVKAGEETGYCCCAAAVVLAASLPCYLSYLSCVPLGTPWSGHSHIPYTHTLLTFACLCVGFQYRHSMSSFVCCPQRHSSSVHPSHQPSIHPPRIDSTDKLANLVNVTGPIRPSLSQPTQRSYSSSVFSVGTCGCNSTPPDRSHQLIVLVHLLRLRLRRLSFVYLRVHLPTLPQIFVVSLSLPPIPKSSNSIAQLTARVASRFVRSGARNTF